MFAASLFTALLASSALRLARSDVTPNEPGPGDSFNQGTQCHIAWAGDTNSTTVWKGMAIELMSGSNLGMVHLTTVATDQDGTTSGTFDYPCPEVKPNSAIYFYQFTSPLSTGPQWTTRFTIAGAGGETTPPENQAQPNGDQIPWGTGALADPTKATPPPVFAGGAGGAGASSGSGAGPSSAPLTTLATTPSSTPLSSTRLQTTPSSKPATSSGRPTTSAQAGAATNSSNAAINQLVVDARVFHAAVILGVSTVAFTVLL